MPEASKDKAPKAAKGEKTKRGEAPATSMTMRIGGLPTPGPVRWIASAIALAATLGTALWALSRRRKAPVARDHAELEALARSRARALAQARATGEVGPATFEAEKRRLVDDLARALSA